MVRGLVVFWAKVVAEGIIRNDLATALEALLEPTADILHRLLRNRASGKKRKEPRYTKKDHAFHGGGA
jgi:hypothetical protein